MAPRKSWVWEYITLSENKKNVICDICKTVLSYNGSTSVAVKHLRGKHNEECFRTSIDDPSSSECPPKKFKKRNSCSTNRQEEINQALAKLIATNLLPINFSNSVGFKKFMAVIEPEYQCPCPQTILKRIQLLYRQKRKKIEAELSSASSLSVTTDGWSSRSQDGYISSTAHFINENWTLKNFALSTRHITERHTTENLKIVLNSVYEEWHFDNKLFAMVHDNASNMNATANLMDNLKYSISCAAHSLQLCIKDAFREVEKFSDTVKKGSKLVQHLHHSNLATSALHEKQKQLNMPEQKLIQCCPTRWNSTYYMCERLLHNRDGILSVLNNRNITNRNSALKLEMAECDWFAITDIITILKPFNLATIELCSETNVTISLVLPIIHSLINNHLKNDNMNTVEAKEFKNALKISLTRRFEINSEYESAHRISCFLDPRSKNLTFENNNVKNTIIRCIRDKIQDLSVAEDVINEKTISSALGFIYQKESNVNSEATELEMYLSETQIDHNSNPLLWWKTNGNKYKRLTELAKMYLSIPATSASSERIFSTAGNIVTPKRSCLLPENVDLLVFLYQNRDVDVENANCNCV